MGQHQGPQVYIEYLYGRLCQMLFVYPVKLQPYNSGFLDLLLRHFITACTVNGIEPKLIAGSWTNYEVVVKLFLKDMFQNFSKI